jgi:hypothetical protein
MKNRVLAPGIATSLITAFLLFSLNVAGLKAQTGDLSGSSANQSLSRGTLQSSELAVDHSDCSFLGSEREKYARLALQAMGKRVPESQTSIRTREFSRLLGAGRAQNIPSFSQAPKTDTIDYYINNDFKAHNITPADKADDYTFFRRVTLDLTGRIPTPADVLSFVNDSTPNKRALYIDKLLASSQWVDKWTMYFGDLYQNNASNTQIQRKAEGRNAFYKWIHDSLAANKPYNTMASELIAAQGTNSFDQANGQINYLIGGVVTGGPTQDIFDQQTTNVADQLLGIAHVNCLLCHNGRGHLDSLSLWGGQTTRTQAEQLSAFMSHTWPRTVKIVDPNNPNNNNLYYWKLDKYTTDYNLNTTTGNRPARQPVGTMKTLTPAYLFNGGGTTAAGEDYRTALARYVTNDPQFARAAVNYIWAQLFQKGIVDPPDQFDPARQDPANPPPAPWTLQPSNAYLLNALANHFIASGYDLQALMREIANSETYQLSGTYNGTWDPSYEPYFARKFVRRLWPEELHDAIAQATNVVPSYNVGGFSADSTTPTVISPGFGKVSYAMQLPDVVNMPDGGNVVSQFLDTFLRGDRDTNPRKEEGSILQTLYLMNDNFIESRVKATIAGGPIARNLGLALPQFVDTLYLTVLSRHPTSDELNAGIQLLQSGNRGTSSEDLLWTLFNKVDFIFNY